MVALLDRVPPVLTRTALDTCQWTAALMAVQVLFTLLLRFIQWRGVHQRTHRLPSAPKLELVASDVLGWGSYMAPHCFLQAWMSCHAEYTYIAEMTHSDACQCQSAWFSRAAAV